MEIENKKIIKKAIGIGLAVLIIPNLFYIGKFCCNGFSNNPEAWGQYGDFVGGILNPIFSLTSIIALLYLTITVSHVDDKRATEQMNVQKLMTLNQMRYDALKELSKNMEVAVSIADKSNNHKSLDKFLIQLLVFEKNLELLFEELNTKEFRAQYFTPFKQAIKDLIAYYERGNLNDTEEHPLASKFGTGRKELTGALNKFLLKEMSITPK